MVSSFRPAYVRGRTPVVGDRVVARLRVPNSREVWDIIGHLVEFSPEHVRVRRQLKGGLPSEASPTDLPVSDILIMKALSPRVLRNSEIRSVHSALSEALLDEVRSAGGSFLHTHDEQWLMLSLPGSSKPLHHCALPYGYSASLAAVPLSDIAAFFHAEQMPLRLLLPDRIARTASRLCTPPRWTLDPEYIVMVASSLTASDDALSAHGVTTVSGESWVYVTVQGGDNRSVDTQNTQDYRGLRAVAYCRPHSTKYITLERAGFHEHHRMRCATYCEEQEPYSKG